MADRWHYGAPKGLLGRLWQIVAGGQATVRREGPPPQPKKPRKP